MSFEAQLTGFGYGNSMTGEGWPDYVTLDNGGILSVEYETRTYYPVDRYALLALADELEEDACWEAQSPGVDNYAWRLKDVCDRIREALGVKS